MLSLNSGLIGDFIFNPAIVLNTLILVYCLSTAMHGQNINLPVFVCLLCVRHTFCQLAYRSDPSTDFYS